MSGKPRRSNTPSRMSPSKVTILTHDARWRGRSASLRKAAEAALKAEKSNDLITLVLSDDKEVKALNRDYRAKDKPTNVLSFPDGAPNGRFTSLGDIILAYDTIEREAAAQGKKFIRHAQHLVVHGILHLLGYDHEEEGEAERMEAREIKILAGLAIDNPYMAE